MRHHHLSCFFFASISAHAPAFAQRALEDAYGAAEDAFGTRVGSEGVGLYNSRDARGFDPTQAGNIRIEGLYIDQQATIGQRVNRSSTMHVGISAQSYPLPAPTGISDLSVVLPVDHALVSLQFTQQTRGGSNQRTVDVSTPLTDTLGLVGGFAYTPSVNEFGGKNRNAAAGAVMRWQPSADLDVIPFVNYNVVLNNWVQPQIFTAGSFLPPRIKRGHFFGQSWANRRAHDITTGVIVRGNVLANWRLQAGLFRSDSRRPFNHAFLYRNTQTDGTAALDVLGFPATRATSVSGEVRASGVYTQGNYRHTIHLATRGRNVERVFNGAGSAAFGAATIGVYAPLPEPAYTFGPRDKDVVRQITPGATYVGQWARVGEFSVGLQKSFFRRAFGRENAAPVNTRSQPWLYNGTVSLTPTDKLAFYASYTRGLEEFGTAPDNAANRGQPMPADLTSQVDAGLRYSLQPGPTLVAGVFEVKKPYFDRDPANVFAAVGDRSHQGVEVSLSGPLLPGLNVVAGAVLIKARVSGSSVDRGLIGAVPVGTPPAVYIANLQYGPASWRGFALDAQFRQTASHYANRTNTFRIPANAATDVGLRYNFKVLGVDAVIRAQVLNVTDVYGWKVDPASGSIFPTPPRRYNLRIAADF